MNISQKIWICSSPICKDRRRRDCQQSPATPHYIYAPPLTVIKLIIHGDGYNKMCIRNKPPRKPTTPNHPNKKHFFAKSAGQHKITKEKKPSSTERSNCQTRKCKQGINILSWGNLKFDFRNGMTSAETFKLPSHSVSPRTSAARGECVQPFITTYDYYGAIKHSAHTRN